MSTSKFPWTDQTIGTGSRLKLRLWLVLSFLCELSNFRTVRSEQHPIITLRFFLMLVPSCWPQHWTNVCTGNNACGLSTPLLPHSRLSNDCTIQSFGHCSAWCARLGSACLGSFLESKWLLYLLTPDPHLNHAHICILFTSPHAIPTWISHQARWGFLHGNSSLFSFWVSRDDTHTFCIFIYQAQSFPIELVIWLFVGHCRVIILTYGANYPSWSASIIWHHSLYFCYKPCVLDIIIMRHHPTFQFWQWHWCTWHIASNMLIGFSSISPRYA